MKKLILIMTMAGFISACSSNSQQGGSTDIPPELVGAVILGVGLAAGLQ